MQRKGSSAILSVCLFNLLLLICIYISMCSCCLNHKPTHMFYPEISAQDILYKSISRDTSRKIYSLSVLSFITHPTRIHLDFLAPVYLYRTQVAFQTCTCKEINKREVWKDRRGSRFPLMIGSEAHN